MIERKTSRRQAIQWLGASAISCMAGAIARAADLPINTTGLEHFGMTVPDPEATAKFYGRIFDGQLFQEKDPPPRFYVKLGTGYLAFGGKPDAVPSIDHFCVLVNDYQPQEMRKSLEAAGVPLGAGPFGMATDPDGLRLQFLRAPGGLAKTIIPAFRLSEKNALFQAVGPDHLMLHVSDLDRSAEHYQKLFGAPLSRTRKPERVWFGAAKTKLGLELVAAGEKPGIHHICLRIAGFDKKSGMEKLKRADIQSDISDEGLLRFHDPNGIVMELKGEVRANMWSRIVMRATLAAGFSTLAWCDPASVNAPAPDGTTALHWAVRADDLRTVESLLAAGADPKAANRYGVTPVSLACSNANAAILKRLLDAGADPNSPDPQGTTALMIASRTEGSTEAVKLLLERGATINARDSTKSTALMWAVRSNHPEAVDLLIHHDAEINARTRKGNPPPRRAPDSGGGSHGLGIVRSGWPERGYQEPTPGEMTALLYAARDGRIDIARTLIAANAQVNQVEANGISPLVMAIANNHIDVARLLLEHDADPNATDWWGRTPLWTAVDLRDLEVNKAEDNGVDRTAALQLIQALLDRGANVNARTKEVPPLRRFLMPISDLSWVDVTGQTPFLRASVSADLPVMRLLLAKGADPNITTFAGTTPSMAAAGVNWVGGQTYSEGKQFLEAVQLCLEKGTDVNAVNSMGITAVIGAANRGSNDILELLVKKGASLDVKDKQGRTPLVWAEGVFLATNPPEKKPSTMALIQKLMGQ